MTLHRTLFTTLLASAVAMANPYQSHEEDLASVVETGKKASEKLLQTLGGNLQKQMKAGGPIATAKFCSSEAFPLTDSVSQDRKGQCAEGQHPYGHPPSHLLFDQRDGTSLPAAGDPDDINTSWQAIQANAFTPGMVFPFQHTGTRNRVNGYPGPLESFYPDHIDCRVGEDPEIPRCVPIGDIHSGKFHGGGYG